MKIDLNKISIKFKDTTGRNKRSIKRLVNPIYNKNIRLSIKNFKKVDNNVFNKTTVPVKDLVNDKSGNNDGISCIVNVIVIIIAIILVVTWLCS